MPQFFAFKNPIKTAINHHRKCSVVQDKNHFRRGRNT